MGPLHFLSCIPGIDSEHCRHIACRCLLWSLMVLKVEPIPKTACVCFRNYELLRTALQAYVAAGWGPRTIIIDNSPDRRLINDLPVNQMHCRTAHPCSPCPRKQKPLIGWLQTYSSRKVGLQSSALCLAGTRAGERDYTHQTLKALLLAAPERHR